MAQLIRDLDPSFVLLILTPLAAIVAGWALRISCSLCAVEPPEFWHSVLAVVMVGVANVILRFWLRVSQIPESLETKYLAPAVLTILIMSMSIRTGPFAAFKVTFVHLLLCGLIYCFVHVMSKSLIAGVL